MNYYMADIHNYDPNIITYSHRPFTDMEEMRNAIIQNWNAKVKTEDSGFILGDIGDPEILNHMKGKITVVLGNHDDYEEIRAYAPYAEISRYPIMVNGAILSHEPIAFLPPEFPYVNIHGHLHYMQYGIPGGKWKDGNRYCNVSVEMTDYKPISDKDIAKQLGFVQTYCRDLYMRETRMKNK